jgi:hypothetical protein
MQRRVENIFASCELFMCMQQERVFLLSQIEIDPGVCRAATSNLNLTLNWQLERSWVMDIDTLYAEI